MADEMISIAMATYNGEKYLREQLDSILAQTHQNFELIVCDDCSTDSTVQILREYEKNDSRIKLFVNEENLGFKKNFENAIGFCSGDYIALSDQDDIWLPEHLQVLIENIGTHSMAGGNAYLIDGEGTELRETLAERIGFDERRSYKIFYRIFCNSTVFYGHSSLYKTVELRKALPIPNGISYHDAWFSACCCVSDGGCKFVSSPISKYRLHGKNASGNHKRKKFLERVTNFLFVKEFDTDRIIYCDEILKRFPHLSEELKLEILQVRELFTNRISNSHRIKSANFILKHYSDIYTTKSKKELLFRIFSILFNFKKNKLGEKA